MSRASAACFQAGLGHLDRGFGFFEHLEGHHLGRFQGSPKIPVGLQDLALAFHLILGVGRYLQVGLLDLAKTAGNIPAGGLHPEVAQPLHGVDLAIVELFDHGLGVVADAVKGSGDGFVALAHVHGRDLLAHHLVKDRRVTEGAGDGDGLFLVQVADLVDQGDHRHLIRLFGHQTKVAQAVQGFVKVAQGG